MPKEATTSSQAGAGPRYLHHLKKDESLILDSGVSCEVWVTEHRLKTREQLTRQ
jgi:hypothetical protein